MRRFPRGVLTSVEMSKRTHPDQALTMVQQALVALGEDPNAPVIGSAAGSHRPLWTTQEERRDVEEFADELLAELTGSA
jgi:hypothetical protein